LSLASSVSLSNLELARFFLAMVLLLFSAHVFGHLFYRLKIPRVIGEIIGGLVLGPSVLGYFFSSSVTWLFAASDTEGKLISLASWFGLILLMFISGFEVQKSFTRSDRRIVTSVLVGATGVSFLAGLLIPLVVDFSPFRGPNGGTMALPIVVGIAVAVTSIPVISRIFIDLKMINSHFAKVVLAIATVEDIILYAALAFATSLASSSVFMPSDVARTVVVTVGFFALALILFPKIGTWIFNSNRARVLITSFPTRWALFVCFAMVAAASLLSVNVVFGAFLGGVAVGMMPRPVFEGARQHVRSISLALFTPLYFAVVGLQLDLIHQFDPLFFLGFLAFAVATKSLGTLVSGYIGTRNWRSSMNLAIALNARGGPGIVLASVAFSAGIIGEAFFVTLVLVAIVTSAFTGYTLRYLIGKGTPLLEARGEPKLQPVLTEGQ
jgi:Kef-type K+ transport system membrane component KefB